MKPKFRRVDISIHTDFFKHSWTQEKEDCPKCKSSDVTITEGYRYECDVCGHRWSPK
ncbi:hypothetical protein EDC32_10387 [Laceyella sacchari]|nr:hypothetical protein EDC32_10387 [Laceyella sacchari]